MNNSRMGLVTFGWLLRRFMSSDPLADENKKDSKVRLEESRKRASFREHNFLNDISLASTQYWKWPWSKDAARGRSIFLSSVSSHFRVPQPILLHRVSFIKLLRQWEFLITPVRQGPGYILDLILDFPYRWMLGLVCYEEGLNEVLSGKTWLEALENPTLAIRPKFNKSWLTNNPEIILEPDKKYYFTSHGRKVYKWVPKTDLLGLACYLEEHVFQGVKSWSKGTYDQAWHRDNLDDKIDDFEEQCKSIIFLGLKDTVFKAPYQVSFPICHDKSVNNYFGVFTKSNYPRSLFTSEEPERWLRRDYNISRAYLKVIPQSPLSILSVYDPLSPDRDTILFCQYTPYGVMIWPKDRLTLGQWICSNYSDE